jgi:hypothetical protein
MTPGSPITPIEEILARSTDDWISAAEVIDVARISGETDPKKLRVISLDIIRQLVMDGLVVPGDVDTAFRPWDCTPSEAVARIVEDWMARDDPFVMIGDIVWLDATQEGQRIGEAICDRESGDHN